MFPDYRSIKKRSYIIKIASETPKILIKFDQIFVTSQIKMNKHKTLKKKFSNTLVISVSDSYFEKHRLWVEKENSVAL
jgi:hypothetical protein